VARVPHEGDPVSPAVVLRPRVAGLALRGEEQASHAVAQAPHEADPVSRAAARARRVVERVSLAVVLRPRVAGQPLLEAVPLLPEGELPRLSAVVRTP
jgi:hypothetical protein